MLGNVVQLLSSVLVLVVGAGLEELLPKVLGVGFPVLLTSVQFAAFRRPLPSLVVTAIAAGAMEDALSSLAPMTSISYFLIVALFTRMLEIPRMATALTYPCYQIWLAIWTSGVGGGVFGRVLVAFPIGLVTAFAVSAALGLLERKAAIDEQG